VCGIGGLILFPPGSIKPEWARAFLKQLEHRGPDDAGWLTLQRGRLYQGREVQHDMEAEVLLIHRRLSILDLSEAGHQPMSTPDGRYWITFNGEIYNYVELREELRGLGHTFRSQSDTEVLLAAYQQWGRESLTRLVGMFAFAILDVQTRRLFLARDCFGIKPLYYALWQEGFAFASEMPPLLELPGVSRDVNPQRLYEYLRDGLAHHGSETIFAHVRQLPSAHYLDLALDDLRSASPARYWDIDMTQQAELSFEEAAKRLRDLFIDSVRMHLRSDVPVGAALSGGIDSSSIVSVMRMLEPKLEIHAFSYVADDPSISEERWVDLLGKEMNLKVHKIRSRSDDLLADLNALIQIQGEPFRSTSMHAQFRVFRAAREAGVKAMLDGQGADELLAGYGRYRVARICSLLRQGHILRAGRLWHCSSKLQDGQLWWTTPRVVGSLLPARLRNRIRQSLRGDIVPAWLNASWAREHEVLSSSIDEPQGRERLKQSLYLDMTETSLPQLLRSEDRNSMAFSIESRVPFLTPALASFVFTLPEEYMVSPKGTTKAVFRRAMRGIVPDKILDRTDKIGFSTPEKQWLLSVGPYVEEVLNRRTAARIDALNTQEMKSQWEQMVGGARPPDSRVWRWMNLLLWAEQFEVTVA
jgi:asparagine synthase (glutamine-hydrolysing)